MIETVCSNCGNKKTFEDSFEGKTFKCPSCSNPVKVQNLGTLLNIEPVAQTNSFEEEIALAEAKALAEKDEKIRLEQKNIKNRKKRRIIIVAMVLFVLLVVKLWGIFKPIYTKWQIENYIKDNYQFISESIANKSYSEISESIENWKYSDSSDISSRLYAYSVGDLVINDQFKGDVVWISMNKLKVCKGLNSNECDEIYFKCFKDFNDKEKFWKESNPIYRYHARYADSLKKILFAELVEKVVATAYPGDYSPNTSIVSSQISSGSGTFTVIAEKSHFYSNPDANTKKKSYLVNGQSGNYEELVNGFAYVTYTNSKNVSTSGWLFIDDLEITPGN